LNNISKQKYSFYIGALIIFLLSALFHFLYDLTDIFFFSFFSAIDESVFEHIKITHFASLLYGGYLYYKVFDLNKSVIAGIFFGLSFIYIFIPTVFYGYTKILGTHYFAIDLMIAFFAGVGFLSIIYLFASRGYFKKTSRIFSMMIVLLSLFTIAFTYFKPAFELFIAH
jgi:hypothetical protein